MPCLGNVGPLPAKLMVSMHKGLVRIDCANNAAFWVEVNTQTNTVRGRDGWVKSPPPHSDQATSRPPAHPLGLELLKNGFRVKHDENSEFWLVCTSPLQCSRA